MVPVSPPLPLARVHSQPSSISDVDSPSDSDWLDIASSRESDDNDSVSSDSDRERVDDIPTSRRSSISLSSSRDGDIDAWEGFVSDSADEASVFDPIALIASLTAHEQAPATDVDAEEEDQRVKAALDQSMVSTLATSRSSSLAASAHHGTPPVPPRDLRLSFPDPLTSSQDELNVSFEHISSTESTCSTSDNKEDVAEQPDDYDDTVPPAKDQGPNAMPDVPLAAATKRTPQTCHLDVVLFGTSPHFKWKFIDSLVKKAAIGAGDHTVVLSHKVSQITQPYTRILRVHDKEHEENVPTLVVSVTDKTDTAPARSHLWSTKPSDNPRLAVVYLPATSALPSPTEFDHYLPVIAHLDADTSTLEEELTASEAVRIWRTLSVPATKTIQLSDSETFSMIDGDDADDLQPTRVHRMFERIAAPECKKSAKRLNYKLNSASAVTLFALLTVVLGFAVNTARTWSHTVPAKASSTSWTYVMSPTINYSSATSPKVTSSNEPIVTSSSIKEFALAILNPGTTSLSMPGKPELVIPEPIKVASEKTWFEKMSKSKDIVARPAPLAPAVQQSKDESSFVQPKDTTLKRKSSDMVSALSHRIPDSFSPLFDFKNVMEAAEIDTAEIMAALDNLAASISKQTSAILEKSMDTALVLRENLQYRNSRAKGKAKELRVAGEQLISFAEDHIRSRAGRAKVKAMALRERYFNNPCRSAASHSQRGGDHKSDRKKGRKAARHDRRRAKKFCAGF